MFDCYLKTNLQILTIFGMNIPDKACHQMTIQFVTSPSVCFCSTWRKHNQRNTVFHAQKQNASRIFAIVWASVCLSVTLVNCIKTVQARITKSSLWAAPRSLVYRDKISCHWAQGFSSNEGIEEGYPLKKTSYCRYWLE